ncbi:unnamed protein product, partial [Scytosiphon promiscuus]
MLTHQLPVVYQGKYAEAEPLYDQSLLIFEKVYGPAHSDVAIALSSRAAVLTTLVRST